jgi:prephenate dehydrogenase
MIKKIAIIGAGGRMGTWFSKYFSRRKGIKLLLYDINASSLKRSNNTMICEDIVNCVGRADLVMVCVPISEVPHTIQECATKMKSGAILIEISSIKNRSYKALERVPKHVRPLCIHPMFGPAAPSLNLMKIILIPIRNATNELRILKELFEGSVVSIIRDAKLHDKFMSIILGLTYFANLVFAIFVSKHDYGSLKQFSGTTFRIQSLLSTSILLDEPDLILALLSENLIVRKQIRKYLVEAKKLERLISGNNLIRIRSTLEKLKCFYQEQQNLELSYTQMYRIISFLNKSESRLS